MKSVPQNISHHWEVDEVHKLNNIWHMEITNAAQSDKVYSMKLTSIVFFLNNDVMRYNVYHNIDVMWISLHYSEWRLNNWGLVVPYGDIDLGQHWLR